LIFDSSALVAIALREPGADELMRAISAAETVAVGAPTLVETAIVLTARLGAQSVETLADFLRDGDVTVIEFGESHWRTAVEAFDRYGKGRHPAALNFGDCLAYATAAIAELPLLARGGDFAQTDLLLA
jgi:ribonuclease VapC